MRRIAVLTSSRADYGIYLPLLNEIRNDSDFSLNLIVFGTHLSHIHGYTINDILSDGFNAPYRIESLTEDDTPAAISSSMALTSSKFAEFWRDHHNDHDLVFCLGDRFEMFAAVISAIPFNIPFAHLHGGETTLGAIDNIFRHGISLASGYHFVSCDEHAKRVAELNHSRDNIYNVGSLSLDKLTTLPLLTKEKFYEQFGIDLDLPTILVTLHPETVSPDKNGENAGLLSSVLLDVKDYQVLITLPNADTYGSVIRKRFQLLADESDNRIRCFNNLGPLGYFSAMKYCRFLLGNSSSGIIEAASFGKWVINLGKRQEGRVQSGNVFNISFNKDDIIRCIKKIESDNLYCGDNVYYKSDVAKSICKIIKDKRC
jgi:GDP/UDP-N,N'-diacetylbacillosamine 2-epimerase (hydrolysing)